MTSGVARGNGLGAEVVVVVVEAYLTLGDSDSRKIGNRLCDTPQLGTVWLTVVDELKKKITKNK